jgi:hypothetical protein
MASTSMMKLCRIPIRLFLVAMLAAVQPVMAKEAVPPASLTPIVKAISDAGGKLTPSVRAMYLTWTEKCVMDDLAAARYKVPQDCLDEVHADATLRDAMFGVIYPPDASILQNYARLREQLGEKYMKKYRSLVVAAAVALRTNGLDDKEDPLAPRIVADKDLFEVADQNEPEDEKNAPAAIADFMKANKVTALDLYQDASRQKQLVQYLKERHIDSYLIARVDKPAKFGQMLKEAMVQLGQRPAGREAMPDTVTWLRYLATVYEARPASTPFIKGKKGPVMAWPLFPMDKAPWPLLMPMARPMPIGEARYIWETFLGMHGPDRYHTYGPYRHPDKAIIYELRPSPWYWNAWPDRIIHGGVCTAMAIISIETHLALCEPAVHASQPNHANLISYRNSGGAWTAIIEQAFAGGPSVTKAGWPFHDETDTAPRLLAKYKSGSEYHLGLAAAMNVPIASYVNTRIAVNLYHALPQPQKKTIGAALLNQAIDTNPYNPAPWYLLAEQVESPAQAIALTTRAMRNITDSSGQNEVNATLEDILQAKGAKVPQAQIQKYWRTVTEYIARYSIVDQPAPTDAATSRDLTKFLKTVQGIAPDELPGHSVPIKGRKNK